MRNALLGAASNDLRPPWRRLPWPPAVSLKRKTSLAPSRVMGWRSSIYCGASARSAGSTSLEHDEVRIRHSPITKEWHPFEEIVRGRGGLEVVKCSVLLFVSPPHSVEAHESRTSLDMPDSISMQTNNVVRHFRQILLWPLQLMPIREGDQIQKHWELLQTPDADNPWREVVDEFTGDPSLFQERHYTEFVTFLPYVQRFLYGEGKGGGPDIVQESSIRVFRRNDVAKVRITYPDHHSEPVTFEVAHVDLYFFYDIDVVILTIEMYADDIPLAERRIPCFVSPEAIRPIGNPAGAEAIASSRWNGCQPTTRCWRFQTMNTRRNISHSSAGTGLLASPPIGSFCLNRWCFTTPGRRASSAIGRSNPTSCR